MNTPTHPTDQANSPTIAPALLEQVSMAMIRHDGLGDPDMVPSTVRAGYDALARTAIAAMIRPELEAEWEAERRAEQAAAWQDGWLAAILAMRGALRGLPLANPYDTPTTPAQTPEPEPTAPPVEGLTVEDLVALPMGARVIDRDGDQWERTAARGSDVWGFVALGRVAAPTRNHGELVRVWGPLRRVE